MYFHIRSTDREENELNRVNYTICQGTDKYIKHLLVSFNSIFSNITLTSLLLHISIANKMSRFVLLLAFALATFQSCVYGESLPAPSGPYNTTLITTKLVDNKRLDPFAPKKHHRSIMVSAFTPIAKNSCSPTLTKYMDSTTAAFEDIRFTQFGLPSGIFDSLELQTCEPCTNSPSSNFPVLFFTPALGTSRLFYSAMAQQVASRGYRVVMLDHPYDADIVTFPDNSTVLGIDFEDDSIPLVVETRAKDISFVLDQLSHQKISRKLFPGTSCGSRVTKAGVFGHSLGGAAAAEAMLRDKRLVGGINLDGSMFGKVVDKGLRRPFMIFAHDGKNITTDPTWEAIWPKLTGWKRELMLTRGAHYTFSDLSHVLNVLGYGEMLPAEAAELLGTINGGRALEVVTTYVAGFFDRTLKGKNVEILDRPSKVYPEVKFGRS